MGCKPSKVDPEYQPRIRRADNEDDDDDNRTVEESISSQRTITADDAVIAKLTGAGNHVKIQVADQQAFNNSLVQQRQQAIDNRSYRSTIESWKPKSLQQLSEIIKTFSNGKSLVDRHWIIFYWITCNIEYDTVAYFSGQYNDQSAAIIFRTKKGVCAGYANLYKHLCDELQMPCEIVSGYSKGYGFENRKDPPTKIDHAWNAVEIDRHWYLMESTWGSGHLNEQNAFEHYLDAYYFLPRPNEMIYHHLPEVERWQLLQTPIRMTQFMQMSNLRPIYFGLNIQLISPLDQAHLRLLPGKSYALILIRVPSDVHLLADVNLNNKKIDGASHFMFDKRKQLYRCYIAPVNTGKHKVIIYARQGDADTGTYTSVVDFLLDIKEMPKNIVSFPNTWKNYFDLGLEIISPSNTHLIKIHNRNTHTQVRIKTPDNVELLGQLTNSKNEKIEGGTHVYRDRRKNIWRCKFAPDRDGIFEALIMAKQKSDPGNYSSAVSFKIEAKQIPSPPVSYPETWPLFYDLGLKVVAPQNRATAAWSENASYAEILMQAPDNIQLSCNIEYNNVNVENGTLAQFDNNKKLWQLLFAPERTGQHQLLIFAKQNNDKESPSSVVVKFGLNVTKLRRPMKFPLVYTQFQTKKCQIYTPLDGILKKGSVVPIHCLIPGATDVNLTVDSNWLKSEGYTNPILQRQVTVGSKEVVIYAAYGKTLNYDGLVKYTVQ